MDAGLGNSGYSWYEAGFNADAPDTGLPAPGSTITSETLPDHSYILAGSYTNNNAFLVDSTVSNATVTVTTPAAYSGLSFLTSAGNGAVTVGVRVHHADGSVETNSFVSADWFGGTNVAFTGNGRFDVGSRAFDNVSSGNPRLYSADITLTNTTSPVSSIDLTLAAGTGHAGVFAVSGGSGTGFTPAAISGYNQDMVGEIGAPPAPTAINATTASIDAGMANTGFSFYEQGYNPVAPLTGLPAAGTTLTNASAPDHVYQLPASYSANNAVLVDAENTSATLTLATPSAYTGLSFLTAAGGGAVTINYTISHAGGATETGSLISPDWFNNTPVAFTNQGRVNVENAAFDSVNSSNPRLYGVDISVTNSTPVNTVTLEYNTGNGHAVILAVSGSTGSIAPIIDVQPAGVSVFAGGTANIGVSASGAGPLQFQWQRGANGTFSNLGEGGGFTGTTTTNLMISNATTAQSGPYRVTVSNASGSSTSLVAQVNILSTATDVTAPGDEVTSVGGASPDAEQVANAIDNTTSKYLNFGTDNDQNAPFVGPVGLVVTPSAGSTVVTGLRFYTANDAVERDPVDYLLEGSNDGANFTQIASGALSLPDARNASALELDPTTQPNQEVLFSNSAGYTSYKLTFQSVKNNATANSMQIGEIEFLGTTGTGTPTPQLTLTRGTNGSLTLTSSIAGTLQSATSLGTNTTWQNEGPINGSVTITPGAGNKFYRVTVP